VDNNITIVSNNKLDTEQSEECINFTIKCIFLKLFASVDTIFNREKLYIFRGQN